MTNPTLRRIHRRIVEDYGWVPGTASENELAFRLSQVGLGPSSDTRTLDAEQFERLLQGLNSTGENGEIER